MFSISKLFVVLCFSFLCGVFINNILSSFLLSSIVLSLGGVLFLNFYVSFRKGAYMVLVTCLGCFLGLMLSFSFQQGMNEKVNALERYYKVDQKLLLEIETTHKIKEFENDFKVKLLRINEQSFSQINGLLSIPSNFTVKKGDLLEVNETILPIKNFSDGFNYEKFLYSKNVFFTVKARSIHTIGHNEQNPLITFINKVRVNLLGRISKMYPYEEGIFLGGILLGARESLPKDLKDDFNASGLTHFIAVSGFNITILIVFLSMVLKVFPVFFRVIIITISIILFTLLVGDAVPVIRASIMGLIAYYILISGRDVYNLSLILLVACIMVIYSPFSLNYDVSFHLSFLAVVGIIYTQEFFKKLFFFLPEVLAIKEAFVLTLSALSFALPVMVFNFGQLSLLSPFANIAVTWTIPLAMLGGFMSIILDSFSHTVGLIFSYLTWVLLAWDIKVVHFFGGLDWAILHFNFGYYKYSLEILYFSLLIFTINYFNNK